MTDEDERLETMWEGKYTPAEMEQMQQKRDANKRAHVNKTGRQQMTGKD